MNTSFTPRLALFQCQFNQYSDADQQQVRAMENADVKIIRVPCAGRISPLFILNAVQGGVDGILICGCEPEKCHFREGNLGARRHLDAFREFLVFLGLEPERIDFLWLAPAMRGRLTEAVNALSAAVAPMGPATRLVTRPAAQGVQPWQPC